MRLDSKVLLIPLLTPDLALDELNVRREGARPVRPTGRVVLWGEDENLGRADLWAGKRSTGSGCAPLAEDAALSRELD